MTGVTDKRCFKYFFLLCLADLSLVIRSGHSSLSVSIAKSEVIRIKTKNHIYNFIYIDTGCKQMGVHDGTLESLSFQRKAAWEASCQKWKLLEKIVLGRWCRKG